MLFNRIMVFLGGVIIFALGLLLVLASLRPQWYAGAIEEFLISCNCIWPNNAVWYGTLGVLLMFAPLLYIWNIFSDWRRRRFWQVLMGPSVISLDLKPMERALRNQLELQEDIESAKIRLAIPAFGRNHLIGDLLLTIAEQPNLGRRIDEIRDRLIDQVRSMLPELKLDVRIRIRLATRLDARLFTKPSSALPQTAVDSPRL